MRITALVTTLAVLLLLLGASAASAAPTCQNRDGDTVHCGIPGAMPLGWKLPPEEFTERQTAKSPPPSRDLVVGAFAGIVLLLALIGVLPEFDGTKAADWDPQEEDDPRR
jgi:hypothetical protein